MPEPDDKTLLEFVARFAGWTELERFNTVTSQWLSGRFDDRLCAVPDYLGSVDAFIADVGPKIEAAMNGSMHFPKQGKDSQAVCREDA